MVLFGWVQSIFLENINQFNSVIIVVKVGEAFRKGDFNEILLKKKNYTDNNIL